MSTFSSHRINQRYFSYPVILKIVRHDFSKKKIVRRDRQKKKRRGEAYRELVFGQQCGIYPVFFMLF